MQSLIIRNKRVVFTRSGSGFPVVFLHGFCEDRIMWENYEAAIAKAYEFIAIDLPGFGGTDVFEDVSIADMADIVFELLTKLDIEKIILLGHSMGGYVTLAFIQKYQSFIKGIGLIHSHPFADTPAKKEIRQKSIDHLEEFGSEIYIKGLMPRLFPDSFLRSNPKVINQIVNRALGFKVMGIITALNAMKNRPDRSSTLEALTVPVLFIIGRKDELESQESLIKQTHLPEIASIHLLDNIGHMGPFEAPEKIKSLITNFIVFCLSNQT